MAFPVIAALVGLAALGKIASAAAGVYSTYESTANLDRVNSYSRDFSKGYYDENTRFWDQYISRHHLKNREILYPYRSGFNYNLSNMYSSEASLANNELSRNTSWFRLLGAGTSVGPSIYRSW